MTMTIIGECSHKNRNINVMRDQHGKFYIYVDGVETQKRLNATEMCRWLCNAMHEEVTLPKVVDALIRYREITEAEKQEIIAECKATGNRIPSVKRIREITGCGLREAVDLLHSWGIH